MADSKYFQRGKTQELRDELAFDKKDVKYTRNKNALKKVVANMTMGNDMSGLFTDVLQCINLPSLDAKKMVYLYLISYAKSRPELVSAAAEKLARDADNENPLIRALALRTLSNIPVENAAEILCIPLKKGLADKDPYVCKTAALAAVKLFSFSQTLFEQHGIFGLLNALMDNGNALVVANAIVALSEIAASAGEANESFIFTVDISTANKLLSVLDECTEWSQTYILESLLTVVPHDSSDAELLVERISPRLQHSNSAIVIASVRVMLYFTNFFYNDAQIQSVFKRLGPPLVTLLHNRPEIEYIALRNIQLILQRKPDFLTEDLKVFFCKYSDPIYVKLAKLDIISRLANDDNIGLILPELKEYSSEVDIDFVRKSVRSIGRCAIKIPAAADKCIEKLVELVATKVNYVVQEAIVVIKDIFRKYPNRYESIIAVLCENLDTLDEAEAKASMVWIVGHYADRIENADELLEQFLESFIEDALEVQLALLTAVVKLFIKRPSAGQELVPKLLKMATESVDNPDLRDRGFIYWRLLSSDPVAAKSIILCNQPPITMDSDSMDGPLLNQLLYHVSTLSSLTHKPPKMPAYVSNKIAQFPTRLVTSQSKAADERNDSVGENSTSPNIIKTLYSYETEDIHTAKQSNNGPNQDLLDLLGLGGAEEQAEHYPDTSANQLQQIYDAPESSAYNPFVASTVSNHTPMGNQRVSSVGNPYNSSAAGLTLDPFAKTSSNNNGYGAFISGLTSATSPAVLSPTTNKALGNIGNDLFNLTIKEEAIRFPKLMLLTAQMGRGLEIQGNFVRTNGTLNFELSLTNRTMQALNGFAMLFNKNSFCLAPAQQLEIRGPLLPNQTADTTLKLQVSGLPVPSTPINNLQVAVKSDAGIVYFQTVVPLYIFFSEGGDIGQQQWLNMWKNEKPSEASYVVALVHAMDVAVVRKRLQIFNIFTIAERRIEGVTMLYLSVKLDDGTLFLIEMKLDDTLICSFTTKSFAPHLFDVFHISVQAILTFV